MHNMKDIFKLLRNTYKNYNITIDDVYNCIIIKNEIITIICDDSKIELYIKNKNITHQHFENETYDEIYDVIVNYINNYDIIKRKQVIKNFIYVSIVIIIGLIIYLFYS